MGKSRCMLRNLTLKRQRSWPLASMLSIAAITLAGQVQSRPSSRVRFTRQFNGCGCPAITEGLDGFCPALDNSGSGSMDTAQAELWELL